MRQVSLFLDNMLWVWFVIIISLDSLDNELWDIVVKLVRTGNINKSADGSKAYIDYDTYY